MPLVNHLARLAATALVAATPLMTSAQAWPAKPVKLVVPYTPGGGADTLARLTADGLSAKLGQPVLVENKPGANTIIATEYVAAQPADGYTLLYVAAAFGINPSLYKLKYDTEKSFTPVGLLAVVPLFLVVNQDVPVNSVKDLIALAKAKPGTVTYASYGSGSPAHLAGELFDSMTGTKMLHVPYKGSTPALTDVIGGRMQISFSSMPPAYAFVKAGRLKGIAVTTSKRVAKAEEFPTVAESGVPGYEASGWNGIVVPAGTPEAIVTRLNQAIDQVVNDKAFHEKALAQGYQPETMKPAEFAQYIHTEIGKWAKVVKDAHVTVE
ncbi:MAG TPA: tripartite tricarboxylate transporter substrate binding protein [Usitatibacter sp.]|nr:tripartite tricarboxylate transporter substrate binding protein [Usitatibacter sp.]